ncbi:MULTISPECIES: hypothetical protein [Acidobacterium]|nr:MULTISPECIES: hypothetical protein [Acidobacterium]
MSISVLNLSRSGAPAVSRLAVAPNESVQGVMTAIRSELSLDPAKTKRQVVKRMADFTHLLNHLAKALKTTPIDMTVHQVVEGDTAFLSYVMSSHLSHSTKRQLLSSRNTLLRYARRFGFSPGSFAMLDEWEVFADSAGLNHGSSCIVKDAMRRGRHRCDFSMLDLNTWAETALSTGKSYAYIRNAKSTFLRAIRDARLEYLFPALHAEPKRRSCKLPLTSMAEALQGEIDTIIASRRAAAEQKKLPLAPATEQELISHLEDLVGYAVSVRGMVDLTSLRGILNPGFIFDFAHYLRKERGCKRNTIVGRLSRMFSSLRCTSAFDNLDLNWIEEVYRKLRREPESALKARRRMRYVPYQELASVPGQMRARRLCCTGLTRAWRIHNELLISCLILAQWPPRFLRQAELGPNIFRGPIPKDGPPFGAPMWAKEQLIEDPDAEFWQFSYEDLQGELHRGLVLRQIVPVLECYVNECRPMLLNPEHPKLLFFNQVGQPLSSSSLGNFVSGVIWRYLKKRASPTSIRSSFAYYWRDKYPDKDAVLAKIQWVDYATIKMRYDTNYRSQRAARVQRRKCR